MHSGYGLPAACMVGVLLPVTSAHASDDDWYGGVAAERLESRIGEDRQEWDVDMWLGDDYRRLIARTEGTAGGGDEDAAELQLLASFAVGPYSDFYAGIRLEDLAGESVSGVAIGLQGDARYLIDYNLAVFATEDNDVLLRAELERQFLLTQHWIVEARVELNASFDDSETRNVDSGLNQGEAGLRLRYEITRRFAPYAGWEWKYEFDDRTSETYALAGLRFAF